MQGFQEGHKDNVIRWHYNVIRVNQSTGKDFQDTRKQCDRVSGSGSRFSSVFKAFLLAMQVGLIFFSVWLVSQYEQQPWLTRVATAVNLQSMCCRGFMHWAFRGRPPADLYCDERLFDLLLPLEPSILCWPLGIHSHIQRAVAHWTVCHFEAIWAKRLWWFCHSVVENHSWLGRDFLRIGSWNSKSTKNFCFFVFCFVFLEK